MAQAITDYVKFLADARDAVYRLEGDTAAAKKLEEQEKQQAKELAAAQKAVEDTISQTLKKRREEIDSSYDREIEKGQEKLKKARTRREKARTREEKERIAEETSQLREHNRDLKLQMKTLFQKDKVPGICRTTFYYALYCPGGFKEILIGFLTLVIAFLAIPCGIYFLIPERQLWHLIAIYFADIFLLGGLYVLVGNRTRGRYQEAIRQGRAIRDLLRSNEKKIRVITKSIQKDKNESVYDLKAYDEEIAAAQQELSETASRKQEAISVFENTTAGILTEEIRGSRKEAIQALEQSLEETRARLSEAAAGIKEQNIYITDTYGPYLGAEFLEPDKLAELSRIMQAGSAANLTEAVELYRKNAQERQK